MIFGNTEVWGFTHAIRGMRNPLESWSRIDTLYAHSVPYDGLGKNDKTLMRSLIKAGVSHRKFARMIMVSVDITAPQYWWSEFDTYKIGTVANSTSKMHTLGKKEITADCFEHPNLMSEALINFLEYTRKEWVATRDKETWKVLLNNLPQSWLQTRTVLMNYEVVYNMFMQRKNHKLDEWKVDFIKWAEDLPCFYEMFLEGDKNDIED